MERWWLHLALASFVSVTSSDLEKKERVYAVYDGQFIIGALFAIHHQPSSAQQQHCGEIWEQYGVQRTEVTFKTLDEINRDPTLLPNITLGAEIRDSCWYAPVSLHQTIELVRKYMTPYDPQMQCLNVESGGGSRGGGGGNTSRGEKKHLLGVLGPGPSSVSMQVQNLLQLFSAPQVGYSATSADLSNKGRFSTFFRMVPSDDYQARALVDLVRYHNWTYVSTINTDENYGQSGINSFRKHAAERGVCIAKEKQILSTAAKKEFDALVDWIRPRHGAKPAAGAAPGTPGAAGADARVVVCFCEGKTVMSLLAAIKRRNMAGEVLLIGSDGWANRGDIAKGYEKEAHGSLTLRIHSPPVKSFDDYYLKLDPYNNTRNPWFKEMWEHQFNCTTSDAIRYRKKCTGLETPANYTQDPKMNFVVRGIYAMAHALHNMQHALCGARGGICPQLANFNVTLYKSFLHNVSFTSENGVVGFDEQDDPPESNSVYDIMNYQRVGDGYRYVKVGSWIGGTLSWSGAVQYSGGGGVGGAGGAVVADPARVHSVCSKPCAAGYIKLGDAEKRCCWTCTPCVGQSIQLNETSCRTCENGTYANKNKTLCIESPIEYIKWSDTMAIVAVCFACIGFLSTIFTAAVFIKYNQTPVVKSSTRELSYLILVGILVSHASVFTILAKPSIETCALSRTLPGISFAMTYASIFTKTNRIARILAGSKKMFLTRKPRFMSGTAQVAMTLGLTLAAGGVCCYCLLEEPPAPETQHPGLVRSVLVCRAPPRAVLLPLSPALALLAACAVLAVRTRALPQNFNEAKFIGVATYTTCVIWIAFFPTYFGSDSKSITLCMCVTLSATVTLIFLFFPRLYIVLLHPERNNRAHFITSRSIRCHIGRLGDARGNCGKRPERHEILGMECKRAELRSISCQTSLEQSSSPCAEREDLSRSHSDWAELDPKPFLNSYKCQNQNHYNANIDSSPSRNSVVIRSNPISLSFDVQTHARIREETVSECSLTDEDSMTQIKDITITLGLANSLRNRGIHCCRDGGRETEDQQNGNKYF